MRKGNEDAQIRIEKLPKFGVNMSKLCRDTASDAVWHLSRKFVDALNENCFVYRHEIHNFLPAWSEDDPSPIL